MDGGSDADGRCGGAADSLRRRAAA